MSPTSQTKTKPFRTPKSTKGRMTVALRDAAQTMRAIQKAGFTGDAGESWRPAKDWLDRHSDLLRSLTDYGEPVVPRSGD